MPNFCYFFHDDANYDLNIELSFTFIPSSKNIIHKLQSDFSRPYVLALFLYNDIFIKLTQ